MTQTLLIFGKSPIPGLAKTRLAEVIGQIKATELYKQLLAYTVNISSNLRLYDANNKNESKTANLNPCPQPSNNDINWQTELWLTPDTQHPFCQQLNQAYEITLKQQQGNYLGDILTNAITTHPNGDALVLIGSDCPVIATKHIKQAFLFLQAGTDIVIAPAEDGGFALLGLSCFSEALFNHIAWSTDTVSHQLKHNCQTLDLSVQELETLWDIDNATDLPHLKTVQQFSVLEY